MTKVILITLATAATLLSACSKNTNLDPVANIKTASDERDLQNKNFTSKCDPKPVDYIFTAIMTAFSSSIKTAQTVYRFSGANVTRTTRLYPTTDCSGDAAVTFEERGDFDLHKDQQTKDGGKAIDIDFKSLDVTTVSQVGVDIANKVGLCSAKDWSVNSTRDESAHASEVTCLDAQIPRHVANVYRVDAQVLYLGSTSNQPTDPAQRPTSLDMTTPYAAQ